MRARSAAVCMANDFLPESKDHGIGCAAAAFLAAQRLGGYRSAVSANNPVCAKAEYIRWLDKIAVKSQMFGGILSSDGSVDKAVF